MEFAGFRRTVILSFSLLLFAAPVFAQAANEPPLTNADVVKMLDAGIPATVVVRKIEVSKTNFVTTPDVLIALKREHVPDKVLAAMVSGHSPAKTVVVQLPRLHSAGGASATQHPHQLPNVEATFRTAAQSTATVQIQNNQIKVEKAGVPLFSVSWKATPAR